ncbi:MAG: hypothetical protein HYZ92_03555 [Candidatus Omnitrophica bacterium]|nr:hypothetical protein [Candidatus Omnitrophota bacterium]
MRLWDYYTITALGNCLTSWTLALFVFKKNSRSRLHRSFAMFAFFIGLWAACYFVWSAQISDSSALFFARALNVAALFIPSAFLQFAVVLTDTYSRHRRAVAFFYGIAVLIAVLGWSRYFVPTVRPLLAFQYYPAPGRLYHLFVLSFALVVIYAHLLLFRSLKRTPPQIASQIRYVLFGSLVGFVGGSMNFLPVYGILVPPFGNGLVVVFMSIIAYAIVRHRLMDIHIVLRRSAVYSVLVTLLTVGYFAVVYVAERLFQVRVGYQSVWVSLAAFALMALVFQPLRIAVQRLVDRLFFQATREELARRLERLEQETRQTERLRAVSTLAAGMAHEIKNPLTSIKTFVEYLPERYDDPDFREKFTQIVGQEVEKMNHLIQRLLDFAKPSPPRPQPVRLSGLINETLEFLQGNLVSKHIDVVRGYATHDEVLVDPAQMRQVFLNVFLNSIEAMDRPGCITVTTVPVDGHLEVIVADTGRGIPLKHLSRIFEPFYTTKPLGTGLGLSVVHGIIREHGGAISVDSAPGRGTTFRIRLPLYGRQRVQTLDPGR